MTANLSPKAMLGDVLWCALGRRNLVRLARFLSNHSRLDTENTSDVNGEFAVLRRFLASRDICSFCGIDVGANVGLWTISAIETARKFHQEARIHAFEPCGETFATLQASLGQAGVTAHVTLNNSALSSSCGTHPFYSLGANVGRNSLYGFGRQEDATIDIVRTTTLDQYRQAHGLDHIDFIKIDTEGHEMDVLLGGKEMISSGNVDVLQFEYNQCWIKARRFLKDAFEFFQPAGFEIGKITPLGIEFYQEWHYELESFREANFLAVRRPLRPKFKEIKWWNYQ